MRASLRQTSTYSSMEKPLTLAMTGFRKTRCSFGSSSAITASTPGFCRPTALSIPPGASAMRGCAIAGARVQGRALEGKCAEAVDIVELRELVAVAEGAAGGDDRIFQLQAAERDAQSFTICSSSFLNTGPSRQTRFGPFSVSIVQPMQAPKPQPIRRLQAEKARLVLAARQSARSIGSGPQAQKVS